VEEATLEPAIGMNKLQFIHLPAYARFIKDNHLVEYIWHQLKGARKLNTPLLRIFGDMPDEGIVEASIPGHTEFLTAAEENKLYPLLRDSNKKWINDQLEIVGREEIQAEDITQVSYLRKTAMLHFMPFYSNDIPLLLELVREIDCYQLEADTLSTSTYIDILQEKLARQTLALKASEEQLLEAQRIADIGSFDLNYVENRISVSPQLLKVLDLNETGDFEYFLKKVHPADKEKVRTAMDAGFKTGDYECEYRLETQDGRERIIWSRGVITLQEGKPATFKGTVMDVTEKQHMVQRLQRSEELYKQAQAMSHIGNWSWDLMHNRLAWSDELYRIYGIARETEITYDRIYAFNHPDDAPMITAKMEASIRDMQPFEYHYRIRTADGREKTLHAHGKVLVDEGKPFKLIGTLQDVTEQQFIEQQLRNSREFIEKIANTTPSLIASYNTNTGKFTFINRSLHSLLGYEPDELMNKGMDFYSALIHPEDLEGVLSQTQNAIEEANQTPLPAMSETVFEIKYRMQHESGHYIWFKTFATVFDRNSEGKVEHLLNVSIDITEQEIAEQKLQQKNIELQQSNASLEEYAYVASHDLKEPLRKIATFSDRLLSTQEQHLSEEGKIYLHKIIDSSKRMQKMISDLLAVSVIAGNKNFEVVNLGEILGEVLQTLEYKIEEKNAKVHSDELPLAKIVPSQFRQLFQNLIGNSLKFSRSGVTPVIELKHQYLYPDEVASYHLAKANKYLKIELSDNGMGFDNQFANKIFTIFQRLHGKTEYEGTGIGLAICRKIAENHGGTIMANGQQNRGSIFTIIIPA